jgi:aspartate/methionine/tyrosine aminotransferase
MNVEPFKLERYFARYEFSVRYLLCASDPESMTLNELLALEPGADRGLHDVWLGYTESRGDPELRDLLAQRVYGGATPSQILVHGGAQEAIFTFMSAALRPGDHVIVQFPAYQSHYSLAQAHGVEISRWRSDLDTGGAPDPDELARLIRPSTRAIAITTPNNPTGYVFDRARFERVVQLARTHGLWLFSDEVYRGSERDASDRLPCAADCYERGVSLGAMAKAYGLAGLRIGWIATRDRALYDRMAEIKDYLTICNAAPSEFLAKIALRHDDTLMERARAIAARNLDLLDAFFERRRDLFQWHRPRAGTTGFPRYRPGGTQAFCADLAERAGVLLLPSVAFDAGDDRFRIGYGRLNLPEALGELERYCGEVSEPV